MKTRDKDIKDTSIKVITQRIKSWDNAHITKNGHYALKKVLIECVKTQQGNEQVLNSLKGFQMLKVRYSLALSSHCPYHKHL